MYKPLKRSERLRYAPPKREMPRREDLIRLFAKYDVQAPRYTSYPPATQFRTAFDGACYLDHITQVTKESDRPEISLYVHLPFCDTLCYFCGCTMMVQNNREKIAEYLTYLKREISLVAELLGTEPNVVQMHWGGGSPTHLLPHEIASLGEHIRSAFTIAEDAEVSIEIDPRGLTKAHVEAMRAVGFNRASIGVQDMSPEVQIAINRVQPREMTEQVIDWCRDAGISGINLDLIYGLPYQSLANFGATLKAVREIEPDRLAVYNFAYVPWIKPHQALIPLETLPEASSKLALLELAIREFGEAGYEYLGMDHFARPTDTLTEARRNGTLHRNFQGYSTHGGKDLLGFGISAIGRVENAFGQNVKELPEYYSAIEEDRLPIERGYRLTTDDELREYVIMQLMCDLQVDKQDVARLFGVDFDVHFAGPLAELRSLEADGLCAMSERAVAVTDLGRFFLRNIAAKFDAYLPAETGEKVFSRTV